MYTMFDKDFTEKIREAMKKFSLLTEDCTELSKERLIELDELIAAMVTHTIRIDKDLSILVDEDITILKKTRSFLLENAGEDGEIPFIHETTDILKMYIMIIDQIEREDPYYTRITEIKVIDEDVE